MPPATPADQRIAVTAEALYLANLLVLPGLAFVLLLVVWWRERRRAGPLARAHLGQTVAASLWAGAILVIANGAIIAFGGYDTAAVWVVVILYFTVCHSALVLLGAFGLSRAMAGRCWRYPLIGRALPRGCPQ